jgi:hypothetical protein
VKREYIYLTVGSIVASLLLLEIVLRFLPPDLTVLRDLVKYVDDPIGYRLKPGANIEFKGLFERLPEPVTWATNSQRIRHDSDYPSTPAGRRIATFGDSETFGWSVSLEDTFQKHIERLDPGVEVINFGVPGYNTTNILLAMREQIPIHRPHVVTYLFNKNDFDLPVYVSDTAFSSHLLGRLRFLWQIVFTREERKRIRRSDERSRVAVADLGEMALLTQSHNATLVLAFMRDKDLARIQQFLEEDHPLRRALASGKAILVSVEPALAAIATIDDHLIGPAYRALALQLCGMPEICVRASDLAFNRIDG